MKENNIQRHYDDKILFITSIYTLNSFHLAKVTLLHIQRTWKIQNNNSFPVHLSSILKWPSVQCRMASSFKWEEQIPLTHTLNILQYHYTMSVSLSNKKVCKNNHYAYLLRCSTVTGTSSDVKFFDSSTPVNSGFLFPS